MARIDFEKMVFHDGNGRVHNLNDFERVMIPRTAGGYSPGWIFEEAYSGYCMCVLEEKSSSPTGVRTKVVKKTELLPYAKGEN